MIVHEGGRWEAIGDPTEAALVVHRNYDQTARTQQ